MISANKIYQQSGSSLPFKEWIAREKAKGNFIPNAVAMESFQNADGTTEDTDCGCGAKEENNSPMFNNLVFIALAGVLIYSFYKYAR
jgi:hypothetical protein